MNKELDAYACNLEEQLKDTEGLLQLTNATLVKTARRLAKAEEFLLQRINGTDDWRWQRRVKTFLRLKSKS